jgi:hypothetical protein
MTPAEMSTAEKEEHILELGSPWVDLMMGLQFHRHARGEEKTDRNAEAISRAREDYYSNALIVVLECALRIKSASFSK